ncbi:MAG: class I SAM-dependent methyltransferase [Chthoniobacterales bacterium]
MKLSQKVGKLAQPLTYRRAWRRARRMLHPIPLEPLRAKIDPARLQELQARHGSPSADAPDDWRHYTKYLDVDKYLKLNARRVQDLDLHRSSPLDILDLGCGAGFFLFIAQSFGHRGLGLDTGGIPVFDDWVEMLGVERMIARISAGEPMPEPGQKFDLITGFSTAFQGGKKSWRWGRAEWEFLLDDLVRHLKPGGRIFFGLNPVYEGDYYTPEILELFLERGAQVERENVMLARD